MPKLIQEGESQPDIKASGRSASYPWIDLETAVGRLDELWKAAKTYEVPVKSAYKTWDYAEKSSGARLTLAALLSYGLLVDRGANEQRTVKVSPLGVEIMMAPDQANREAAIKTAALKPRLFSDLLRNMDPQDPVSDQVIAHILVTQKGFNPNSTETFLKSFKGTLKYAKLTKSDMMSSGDSQGEQDDGNLGLQGKVVNLSGQSQVPPFVTAKQLPAQRSGFRQDVYNFADGGQVILQWPENMSADDLEEFEQWIELQKKKIRKAATKTADVDPLLK